MKINEITEKDIGSNFELTQQQKSSK